MVEFLIGTACGAMGITVMEIMLVAIWYMLCEIRDNR